MALYVHTLTVDATQTDAQIASAIQSWLTGLTVNDTNLKTFDLVRSSRRMERFVVVVEATV